jgi:hypothetical protein
MIEEKVSNVLYNSKDLLRYAVFSVTESIRNNPDKYRHLIYWRTTSTISFNNTQYSGSYMYVQGWQSLSIEDYRRIVNYYSRKGCASRRIHSAQQKIV